MDCTLVSYARAAEHRLSPISLCSLRDYGVGSEAVEGEHNPQQKQGRAAEGRALRTSKSRVGADLVKWMRMRTSQQELFATLLVGLFWD